MSLLIILLFLYYIQTNISFALSQQFFHFHSKLRSVFENFTKLKNGYMSGDMIYITQLFIWKKSSKLLDEAQACRDV
jgi:hypothetical protein